MNIRIATAFILIAATILKGETPAEKSSPSSSSMADCPMMKDSAAAMNTHGDKAMGFSHEKTTHHFSLAADGGAIEVLANDPSDEATRQQIRGHLGHIAQMFQEGNFQIPMLVHGKMPDGASAMREHKAQITYVYEETNSGGRVRIQTTNADALKAVHAFLRFQITEHQTGDPTETKTKS
jgi:hypothetical protein